MTQDPDATITGQAFAPGASRGMSATLRLNTSRSLVWIETAEGAVSDRALVRNITLEAPLGSVETRLALPDGWLFLTNDMRIHALLGRNRFGAWRHALEAFSPRLIGVFAAAIVGLWAIWTYAIPLLAAIAVWLTPPQMIAAIDRGTLNSFDATFAEPTTLSAQRQNEIHDLFKRLVVHIPRQDKHNFSLEFRAIPAVGPNAFALPGGTMIMTDDMIDTFGDDPDLIAGVLAHEMGHVVDQHGLKMLYRSLSLYVIFALFAGDFGPVLDEVMVEGHALLALVHSKRFERDADQFALELLHSAGISPLGLRRFFKELEKYDVPTDWMSTHPLSKDRVDAIDAFIDAHK